MKKVCIGSGSAYWGDMLEPAVEMGGMRSVPAADDATAEFDKICAKQIIAEMQKEHVEKVKPHKKEMIELMTRYGNMLVGQYIKDQ